MTKFNYNRKQFRPTILRGKLVKIDIQTYFTENSTRDRGSIKKQIMKRKLIPYECQLCHLQPLWNAKELSMVGAGAYVMIAFDVWPVITSAGYYLLMGLILAAEAAAVVVCRSTRLLRLRRHVAVMQVRMFATR